MTKLVITIATFMVIGSSGASDPASNPVEDLAAPLTMEELVTSPTAPVGGFCAGLCLTCNLYDYVAAPGTYASGWTQQPCEASPGGCWIICPLPEEEEDGADTLTLEQMATVSDAVLSGSVQAAADAVARFPNAIRVNLERQSIQFDNCVGGVMVNLPLTEEKFIAILDQ